MRYPGFFRSRPFHYHPFLRPYPFRWRPWGYFWNPWRPWGLWRPFFWLPWTLIFGGFTFLIYSSMIYKLHQDDARAIERDTGKPARDLTEEELVDAMRRRGIRRLELTPEDREAVAESGKTRFCIYCGTPLPNEAIYCSRCGKRIQSAR